MGRIFTAVLLLAVIGAGCTRPYKVNLSEQRRKNMQADLSRIQPDPPLQIDGPMTLEEAIRIGMVNNLDLRISRIMAEIADDRVLAEKLRMLPGLDLNGELSRNSEYMRKEYKDLVTGETSLGRSISEEKTKKTISLSLTWNLLDFGISYIRARQEALRSEVQRMERIRQAQIIARDIATAYWKATLAERNLERIETIETEVRGFRKIADALVSQKRLDPILAKDIEKRLAELSITTANLQSDITGARIELRKLMGLPPTAELPLAPQPIDLTLERMPRPDALDATRLERVALFHRPEFYAADFEVRIQQDEARSVLLTMFPGLRLNYSHFYDDNVYLVNNYWSNVGVGLMMNFLSLPAKYWQLQAEKKTVEKTVAQRMMLTAGVIAQTHMALHDFRVKAELFRLHDNAYAISDDLLAMSRERHSIGTMSETELTRRMLDNMVNRLTRDRHLVDLIDAYHTLLVTLGFGYESWQQDLTDIEDAPLPPAEIDIRDIGPAPPLEPVSDPVADMDGIESPAERRDAA